MKSVGGMKFGNREHCDKKKISTLCDTDTPPSALPNYNCGSDSNLDVNRVVSVEKSGFLRF